MAQSDDKAELISELARARSIVTGNALALRRDLDFATRARKAFKKSPLPWLGGAALAGIIVARFPGRPKKVVTVSPKAKKETAVEEAGKAGLLLGVLKMAFDFARPAVTAWARQRVTDYLVTRQAPTGRPASRV